MSEPDTDAPVIESVGGAATEFFLLDDERDLPRLEARWRYARKQARITDLGARPTGTAPADDMARQRWDAAAEAVRRKADGEIPEVEELDKFVRSLAGARAVLSLSLEGAGVNGDKGKALLAGLLKERGMWGFAALALRVSGLFGPMAAPAPVAENKPADPTPLSSGSPGESAATS